MSIHGSGQVIMGFEVKEQTFIKSVGKATEVCSLGHEKPTKTRGSKWTHCPQDGTRFLPSNAHTVYKEPLRKYNKDIPKSGDEDEDFEDEDEGGQDNNFFRVMERYLSTSWQKHPGVRIYHLPSGQYVVGVALSIHSSVPDFGCNALPLSRFNSAEETLGWCLAGLGHLAEIKIYHVVELL